MKIAQNANLKVLLDHGWILGNEEKCTYYKAFYENEYNSVQLIITHNQSESKFLINTLIEDEGKTGTVFFLDISVDMFEIIEEIKKLVDLKILE